MEGDTYGDTSPPLDDVDDRMSEDRAALLAAIARAGDGGDGEGVPTGRLRESAGIPSGSMPYHMGALEDWGLVEVVGREKEGGGSPSKVYAITARGREYLDRPSVRGFATPEEVAELRGEVETLKEEVDDLREAHEEARAAYNQMADLVEDLRDDVRED